jgi:hypothetical protein
MQQMRQQLKYLQAELCSRGGGSVDEMRVFIVFLPNWNLHFGLLGDEMSLIYRHDAVPV